MLFPSSLLLLSPLRFGMCYSELCSRSPPCSFSIWRVELWVWLKGAVGSSGILESACAKED